MTDFVAPVKAILKALETGIKLAHRVAESAELAVSEFASPAIEAKAQQISESAPGLQRSLEHTCQAIRDAYRQEVEICGKAFSKALVEDKTIQARLKDLKNDVRDSIDECQDFEDDPESFDRKTFMNIQQQADKCSADCISIFQDLRDQLTQGRVPTYMLGKEPSDNATRHISTRLEIEHSQSKAMTKSQGSTLEVQPKDDRAHLSSTRQSSINNSISPPYMSPITPTEPLQITAPSIYAPQFEPVKPKGPWSIENPLNYDMSPTLGGSLGASASLLRRKPVGDVSPTAPPDEPQLIPKEVIHSRISANEEFLERRRQSRIMFNELRYSAVSSIDENRASETFTDGPMSPLSPSPGTSAGLGYSMSRQRSQGHASQGTRSSRTSSIVPDRHSVQRHDSEDSIFGNRRAAPASPSITENHAAGTSGNIELWSPITTTASPAMIDNPYTWEPPTVPPAVPPKLQIPMPSYGNEVPAGLIPVNVTYDDGMIVVNAPEETVQPGPTFTVREMDYPIRPDSSFSKFGGFCDGAKSLTRGETGFKIVKRPAGHYSATVSARCIACSYEVGWNDVEKDKSLDRSGIYGNSGIRFRQRFVSKSHLKANSIESPKYACLFCIEVHKTVEEHDATIFFSVAQLFKHIAKHPQPVPYVHGITVLYGQQSGNVMDFDIHFISSVPLVPEFPYAAIAQKAATRPSAQAISSNNPKSNRTDSRDPDGNAVLHFALGARIIGITFPDRFNGLWAIGYHDGLRGSFPTSTIAIDQPGRNEEVMNSNSNLVAFAKWDFKLKKSKDDPWLKFSKGDTITHIGFKFQDQWCWTGKNAKGQWGLFPNAFVESLHDRGVFGTSPGSVKKNSLSSKMPSFSIGRNKSSSKHERKTSIMSNSSGESRISLQPGLEVVQAPSPTHQTPSSRFPSTSPFRVPGM
ncbi:hypothetical protein N431DRAFT_343674 [Stipitochalara longipes BDJ]|nr:hypothetical protein N431DRAFT_343674 [Stipitochalara longipes BDJ]